METYIIIDGRERPLSAFLSQTRTIVTLGRKSDEVYNVVGIDDVHADIFQCQFTRTDAGWLVRNGQWRTECPRGIRSRLQHACSMCMGRCVNPHTAKPTYSWRLPSSPTLLNGEPLGDDGVLLRDGDSIVVGVTSIAVAVR